MERRTRVIVTEFGKITLKEGLQNNQVVKSSPEYEDCKQAAEKNQVPLKEVYSAVWRKLK